MIIWLLNPYGPIPGEGWRSYRFTLLGTELARRGHAVTWWTANFSHHFKQFRSQTWQDRPVTPGFQIRLVPTKGYASNIGLGRIRFETAFAQHVYLRARCEQPPDFIIGVEPPQPIGFLSVLLSQHFRKPMVLDVFDLWPELFLLAFPKITRSFAPLALWPLFALRRRNWRKADGIASLCKTYLEAARSEAPKPSQCFMAAFNGIDVAAFRVILPSDTQAEQLARDMGKREGDIWVIYAGSLGPNYDVETILAAGPTLVECCPQLKILVAGDGPLKNRVMEQIAATGASNIRFLGKLDHQDLIGLYGICDIGLCSYGPMSNVAMPDKAYDYMAAGLPMVNSLRGELASLLQEKRMGVQYQAGDPQSLASVLENLATHHDKRKEMAVNSFQAAMEFDRAVQYGKFAAFIEAIAGCGGQ